MSLLDRINSRRTIERSADPVTLEEFGILVGQGTGTAVRTTSGVTMGPQRALGIPAWYSGVRYIAETMAGLPCFTFRGGSGDRTKRANPMWRDQPDVETPWFGLVEFLVMSLLHKGNAYAYKIRNGAGQVVGLRPIHPDRVKPGQASDGTKVFQLDGRTDIAFTTREILHIPGLSYDGVVGLNPIQYQSQTLGIVAAADESASRSFQGSGIDAYLSLPDTLTQEQADHQKSVWESHHKGLANSHELAVLGGGAEYKTIGLNPEQTKLLESRKYGVTDVARILRLPPHKLYDLERATFSNIEQQSIEAVTDGIRPWATRLEAWINFDPDLMVAGNFLEFELKGLLRGDIKSEYEAYAVGINGGFIMPSEPRALLNLPYVEGSEFLTRDLNKATVGPDAAPDVSTRPTESVQKVYLGVEAGILTADEARQMVNDEGGNLTGPAPRKAVPSAPAA